MNHALTFRGEDYAIPAGYGRCQRCDALLTVEQWLDTTCPGREADVVHISEGNEGVESDG